MKTTLKSRHRFWLFWLLLTVLVTVAVTILILVVERINTAPVQFADLNLEAAVREAVGKPGGVLHKRDLRGLTALEAANRQITDLSGLQYAVNLTRLDLSMNRIGNLEPLQELKKIEELNLSSNEINEYSLLPLGGSDRPGVP